MHSLNAPTLSDLKSALEKSTIQSLIIIDGNPVYTTPANLEFKTLFPKVPNSFYLGYWQDETAHTCQYLFPKTHFLESWGDTRATDGTIAIRQPLIAPLFENCQNEYSFVLSMSQTNKISDYDL